MATKRILIVDDEQAQGDALAKKLREEFPDAIVVSANEEEDIKDKVENSFYNLLILDIRMDKYQTNGIQLAKIAKEHNPFTKVLFVSRFLAEYLPEIKELMLDGYILDFSEKEAYNTWLPKLSFVIKKYYDDLEENPSRVSNALTDYYAEAKNETDTYKKGVAFENLVSLLLKSIGFEQITKRSKDVALNEIDLIARNDIQDGFLEKFGKYIFVECKNKPDTKTDKNDLILFLSKIQHSHGMAELGVLFTTSAITRNARIQLAMDAKTSNKIIIIDNILMERLLMAVDIKDTFKKIIDEQVTE